MKAIWMRCLFSLVVVILVPGLVGVFFHASLQDNAAQQLGGGSAPTLIFWWFSGLGGWIEFFAALTCLCVIWGDYIIAHGSHLKKYILDFVREAE